MEDIPVNTTKDVSMEILDLNIVDTRPSPFTFTVVDQSTGMCTKILLKVVGFDMNRITCHIKNCNLS